MSHTVTTTRPAPSAESTAPTSRTRRILRRVRRVLRNVLIVILTIAIVGVLAGQVAKARLRATYPPPGELVDVGDRRLHVHRYGDGPTVVFENGPGGMGIDWSLVAPAIAEDATVFTYDRAGVGWSDARPDRPTVIAMVADLRAALRATGTEGPYVLVGHSFGGLVVRAYAYTYPEEVAGLVLLDAAHEDQFDIYPEEYAATGRNIAAMMDKMRILYRVVVGSGIPALFGGLPHATGDKLPPEVAAARRAVGVMSTKSALAVTDEMITLEESLGQVRELRRPLGDVPTIVITHGKSIAEAARVPEGLEDEVDAAWLTMQTDLLSISTNSRLVVAEESGHDIHVEQPELVVDAVQEVLGASTR